MCAFEGFLALAKTILVEILVFTFRSLAPLEERPVEERQRMDEDHPRKSDQQDLEQEIRIEPVGRKADRLNVPAQRARLHQETIEGLAGRWVGHDQMSPHEKPAIEPDDDRHWHHEEQRSDHIDDPFGTKADRGIDQIDTHMPALNECVCGAKRHDQRVVEFEFLGPPADIHLKRNAKADHDFGAREDTLQKDDDDLLDHHDKPGPCEKPPDGVGKPFENAHASPHEPVAPQADARADEEHREDHEEEFHRSAVIDEPHDRFLVRPVEPKMRMADRIAQIVESHGDVLNKPKDAIQNGTKPASCGSIIHHDNPRMVCKSWPRLRVGRSGRLLQGWPAEDAVPPEGGTRPMFEAELRGPSRGYAAPRIHLPSGWPRTPSLPATPCSCRSRSCRSRRSGIPRPPLSTRRRTHPRWRPRSSEASHRSTADVSGPPSCWP